MGTVYRKTATKPLPEGAELFERKGVRFAGWRDAKGKNRTARVTVGNDGSDRIVIEARTFTAKYRTRAGVVEVATGCRNEDAARRVLGELERRAELVKAGVLSTAEDAIADHQPTPLEAHFAAYRAHQQAKGVVPRRVLDVQSQLRRMTRDCSFVRLVDLDAERLERWLADQQREGMGAGTRNEYRGAFVGFCNWCLKTKRLTVNPFTQVPKADVKADRRRHRRAMTEAELVRLLTVARWRPLADYGRDTQRKQRDADAATTGRKGSWTYATLTLDTLDACLTTARERLTKQPELVARLEVLGRERELIYKTLVLTGLRLNELRSLSVGQLDLDGPLPRLTLDAAAEKNREGNSLPIRRDLADDLGQWLELKRQTASGAATRSGDRPEVLRFARPLANSLPTDAPLFDVPRGMIRILDRDLQAAGIAKRDERGRTLDVHALRHTFGTLLSKGGVAPRTAQAAMRHSTINLTMNAYTDPKLLDVQGALESLPALPLDADRISMKTRLQATGTDAKSTSQFAPAFAPTADKSAQTQSIGDKTHTCKGKPAAALPLDVTSSPDKRNNPPTTAVDGSREWAMRDSNPRHPRCKHGALTN